jgi:hypothetical protein
MRKYRKVGRRSFLATVAGGAVAASIVLGGRRAEAHQGCSDSDSGYGADPGGRGRRCAGQAYTGCSDRDPVDPGMRGRSCGNQPRACTDVDGGANADPAGRGRSCGAVRTQSACRECACVEYISTPGNQFAACRRCNHAANSHYGGD